VGGLRYKLRTSGVGCRLARITGRTSHMVNRPYGKSNHFLYLEINNPTSRFFLSDDNDRFCIVDAEKIMNRCEKCSL